MRLDGSVIGWLSSHRMWPLSTGHAYNSYSGASSMTGHAPAFDLKYVIPSWLHPESIVSTTDGPKIAHRQDRRSVRRSPHDGGSAWPKIGPKIVSVRRLDRASGRRLGAIEDRPRIISERRPAWAEDRLEDRLTTTARQNRRSARRSSLSGDSGRSKIVPK